jgi:flagellar protein FlbD
VITVTRLNGAALVVNSDLILTIEKTPDTMLSLLSGEKLVVKESVEDIIKRVVAFRRRIHFADVSLRSTQE